MARKIILERLELSQFQKFDHKLISFSPDQTDIIGDNGAGKTTIYSAFTWLLFGKDSMGREKFDVKRLIDGVKQDKVDVFVEGKFVLIDDNGHIENLTLKRVLTERYQQKTDTYIGDETKCYINDVPKLVGEYQSYITSIVSENEFRMLTSVTYFLSLKKTEQREYLCKMAGIRSIDEIIKDNPNWVLVYYARPNGMSIEDYQKSLKDSLKTYRADHKAIQPSIDALTKSMPEEENWQELEDKRAEISRNIDNINSQISSQDEANNAIISQRREIKFKIADIDAQINSCEINMRNEINKSAQAEREKYAETNNNKLIKERELQKAKKELSTLRIEKDNIEVKIKRYDVQLTETFNQYEAEESKVFKETTIVICPLNKSVKCATKEVIDMSEAQLVAAREKFNEAKVKKLEAIREEGKKSNAIYTNLKKQLEDIEADIKAKESNIAIMENDIANMSYIDVSKIEAPDKDIIIAKYGELKEEYIANKQALNDKLTLLELTTSDADQLKTERQELMKQLEDTIRRLSMRDMRDRINVQIRNITQKGKEIADKIANSENILAILTEIQRAVIDDASQRINAMFQITNWTMVIQQKNGEYVDVCEPNVNGVSLSINTAARINVGLDICNVISHHLGIFVPCFIEARESVNTIVDMPDIQIINLKVAPTGTPLTIIN